jgi:hypothetical protein
LICDGLGKFTSRLSSRLSSIISMSSAKRSASNLSLSPAPSPPSSSHRRDREAADETRAPESHEAASRRESVAHQAAQPPPKLEIVMRQSINQVTSTEVLPSPGFFVFGARTPNERSWRCKAWVTGGFGKK